MQRQSLYSHISKSQKRYAVCSGSERHSIRHGMLFVKKAIQLENKTTVAQKKMKHTYITLHVPFFCATCTHIRSTLEENTTYGRRHKSRYKIHMYNICFRPTVHTKLFVYFRAMLRIARTFMSKDLKAQGGQMSKCLKFCPGV